MWLVELGFTSDPARLEARPAHRATLVGLNERGIVRMAGPLSDESGAVIVFDVPERADVDALIASDPYYSTTGVTVVSIRQWNPFIS